MRRFPVLLAGMAVLAFVVFAQNNTATVSGFNGKGWINIYPVTEQLHLTERYHRRDLAHLDIEATIDDPGTFKHPWKLTMVWDLAPNEEVQEFVCEDNNKDAVHLLGK